MNKSCLRQPCAHLSTPYPTSQDTYPQASHAPPQGWEVKVSTHALVRYMERAVGLDLGQVRQALAAAFTADGYRETPSDHALLRLLLVLWAKEIPAWEEELKAKVARYTSWPTRTFTVIDHAHQVRIVVAKGVVVTVLPRREGR